MLENTIQHVGKSNIILVQPKGAKEYYTAVRVVLHYIL